MKNESSRKAFEDRVFGLYFVRTIERNPNPTGFALISTADKTQAELCARGGHGRYIEDVIEQMWQGWQLALLMSSSLGRDLAMAAAVDVLAERADQRRRFSDERDDARTGGEMALAAAAYALHAGRQPELGSLSPLWWPDEMGTFRPRMPREDLVRSCALGLAEIERLDRRFPDG